MANKQKLTSWLTLSIIFCSLLPGLAFAATGPSCEELNDPAKTKDWIITILEEQLGGKSSETFADQETVIQDCMRVTTVDTSSGSQEGGVQKSKSEYKKLAACPADAKCQRVQVLMAKSGTALLYGYIGFIYRWAAATVGMVCVGMITYYGIRIAAAGGDANKISEAKEHIMQSIGGLILLFLSGVISSTPLTPTSLSFKGIKQFAIILCLLLGTLSMQLALAQRAPLMSDELKQELILPHSSSTSPEGDFGGRLLPTITTIIIGASGGAAVLFIIIGAVQMLTAYGNDEKISKGKQTITFAIVGLIIAILSYAIVTIISSINLGPAPTQ